MRSVLNSFIVSPGKSGIVSLLDDNALWIVVHEVVVPAFFGNSVLLLPDCHILSCDRADNEEEYKQAILELDRQIRQLRRMNQEGTDVGGTQTGGMALGMMDLSDSKWDSMVLDSFARNSLAQRAAAEREMEQKALDDARQKEARIARERMMKINDTETAGGDGE